MADQFLKLIIGGALLLHGLGHGGALGALVWIWRRPGTNTGGWLSARSWLFPALEKPVAAMVAGTFWGLALVGFVAAALGFWDIILPGSIWRLAAIVSAVVSLAGIVLFLGRWPAFNTVAALGMNLVVLIALLWFQWPAPGRFRS